MTRPRTARGKKTAPVKNEELIAAAVGPPVTEEVAVEPLAPEPIPNLDDIGPISMEAEAPRMLFGVPTFTNGLNITVRHRDKWFGYHGEITLARTEDGPALGVAMVVDTLFVPRFEDLAGAAWFLQLEHDPAARNFFGLVKAMKAAYPGDHVANTVAFTREDPVTVVFFLVTYLEAPAVFDTALPASVSVGQGDRVVLERRLMTSKDIGQLPAF